MFLKHKFLVIKLLKGHRFINIFHTEYNMKNIKSYNLDLRVKKFLFSKILPFIVLEIRKISII